MMLVPLLIAFQSTAPLPAPLPSGLCAPKPSLAAAITESTTTPLQIVPGQHFVVVLKSNPTTGYGWRETNASSPDAVRFDGRQYVTDSSLAPASAGQPQPARVGGGGIDLWLFTAFRPGTAMLTFGLYPPGRTEPERTRTFTVRVVPAFPMPC